MAKYYYNGVLLPEIPSDVLAEYPYCWARENSDGVTFDFLFGKYVWYCTDNIIYIEVSKYLWYTCTAGSTEMTYKTTYTDNGQFGLGNGVLWSNHNIPNGSSTSTDIYFSASEPVPEYIQKYLIKTDNKLYTVVDGALSELTITDIVAQTFLDYGIDEIPNGELLTGLSNPEVLCWQDREDDFPILTAIVTATPPYQVIMSQEIDLMHSSIKGINSVSVDCKGNVLFAVSFDNKVTWMQHNGTDWVDVVDELTGMTELEFEAITTEQWQSKYELSSDMYIRCTLTDATQSVTSVNISFIN